MGIISNIEAITHKVVDDWNILEPFEHKFMSYQIGLSKPDTRIYEHVIEILPFDPTQMIFIDDKVSNIQSAKKSSINAIHFTGYLDLVKSLSDCGLNVPDVL